MTPATSEEVIYRAATPHDIEAIARLHADSWRRHYHGALPDAYLDGDLVAERLRVDTPSRYPPLMADRLVVRGAREHNLRDVSLDLPRDKLIVFTGLSGSGKSSLAFDTIYAEGQRRYVESLSAYARQFLGQMDKPDVDFIEGLSPAISIDQKSASRNPRSTVGTITEVYDYLRLLYARIGHPTARPAAGPWPARPPSRSSTGCSSCPRGPGSRCWPRWSGGARGSTAPCSTTWPSRASPGSGSTASPVELAERAEVNLARYEIHTIEVVVDRLIRRDGIRQR
jgi:excinuclease ABC subunit A